MKESRKIPNRWLHVSLVVVALAVVCVTSGCALLGLKKSDKKAPQTASAEKDAESRQDPQNQPLPGTPPREELVSMREQAGPPVEGLRQNREEKLVEEFDLRRDEALYHAAVARWESGDEAASVLLLQRLLGRNPEHQAARLMLADLCVSAGRLEEAENHLRALVDRFPDYAQAHHSLGLLLTTRNQHAAALEHYEQAISLHPGNAEYILSHEIAQQQANNAGTRAAFQAPRGSALQIQR